MKGALGSLMKQAQQMQEQLKQHQEELAALEVVGESGGGMVRITMSGRHDVRRVSIDSAVSGDDREMLEDLVAAAINDAVQKVEATTRDKLSGVTAGMGLPPGFKMPF